MTGRDEKGVPMLHWRPDHHFERLVAFLAWRNEFIEDVPDKAARKGRNIIERIRPMYAARVHLTPATSIERLGNVLGSLLRSGHFRPNSQLRRAFANISDEQIMTRDASIANILPVVFGPKDVMYNPNALSHSDWKALKEEEDITGTRNRGYGYADMPIRPLQDFVEDDEKKAKRKRNKDGNGGGSKKRHRGSGGGENLASASKRATATGTMVESMDGGFNGSYSGKENSAPVSKPAKTFYSDN